MDLDKTIRKYVLQNAIKFKGKANPGAVIGKIFGEDPSAKQNAKEISQKIQETITSLANLSVEDMTKELQSLAPELLEKKEAKERDIFAFLGFSADQKIITAFPPGPEKYPHIGHAKSILLNYLLAKKQNGTFILRFEDTNPTTAKEEYYDIMLEGFKWVGVNPDEVLYASDFMDLFYEKAQMLIDKGLAYVDSSSQEQVKESREKGTPTPSRENSIEENQSLWKAMSSADAGSAIVRLKIDLKHQNTTMRDPTIFRLIDDEHPRQGKKYRIWPNYDFQNAIMDSHSNIDIRLRTKEFELRSELQRWIQEQLEIPITKTFEFGRFNLKGVLSSGRIIREKVESKELIGWDDPTLTTLAALKRRGFLPEAIKNFVLSTGISKAEATLTWDDLIMHNKRLLDNDAKRYSAIFDPIEVTIKGAPTKEVELHLNPNEKKGGRSIAITEKFILSQKDVEAIQEGELVRLLDAINIKKEGSDLVFDSESFEDFKGKGKKIINWLSTETVSVEVLMTDKTTKKGVCEKNILSLEEDEVIQFERNFFARLDQKENILKFWFTHQ